MRDDESKRFRRIDADIKVECQSIVEFGEALAAAAQRCYEYPDRMRVARLQDESDPVEVGPSRADQLRAEHRGFLRRTIALQTLSMAVLDGEETDPLTTTQP